MSYEETYSESSDNAIDYDDSLIGTILNKQYVIIYGLGKGSFATVWLVYDMKSKDFNALKIHNHAEHESANNEINLLKQLKGNTKYLNEMTNNFVYVNEDKKECVCIVFPLMAGSLYDLMKKGKYEKGFPLILVKKVMYQLLVAMNHLYVDHNIIHTDIKPDNMLLVGINKKISNIIKQFNKNKFEKQFGKNNKKNYDDLIFEYVIKLKCVEEYMNYESESGTESESINDDINELLVDEQYTDINKITMKLSDFGSNLKTDKLHHSIQTIYYRSPEAILEYNINEKCDSWSIGCTLYELLTGNILFDPNKTDQLNRDRNHILDMYILLGPIQHDLLSGSKKYKYFYTKDGLLKGVNKFNYTGISNLLLDEINNKPDIDNIQLNYIIDLLYKLLKYNPNDRLSFKECMDHPFFKDIQQNL